MRGRVEGEEGVISRVFVATCTKSLRGKINMVLSV